MSLHDAFRGALAAQERRTEAAKPIAARTGESVATVYQVLLDAGDDASLAEQVVVRAREMNVDPSSLLGPARRP